MGTRRQTHRRTVRLLLAVLLVAHSPGAAAEHGLSRPLYQALDKVRTRIQEGQAGQALAMLERAAPRAVDDYSRAVVEQTYGYVWLELDKPESAAGAFRKALELDALPESAQNNIRYNLAGILARLDRTGEAVRLLEAYLETAPDPPVAAKTLLGRLYLDQARHKAAVRLLETVRARLPQPDETVLLLLVSAYGELKQVKRTAPLLEELVRIAPRRAAYWQQLAAARLALGQEGKALAVLESAYLQGLIRSPDQLRYLAWLYLQRGLPYKAGRLIETEIGRGLLEPDARNGRLAAQAWQTARENEKAVASLEQAVAGGSDPDLLQQLAGLYLIAEAWEDAARALRRGIEGATGEQRDRMQITLGVVRYRQRRMGQARAAFERTPEESPARGQAERWLEYLDYLEASG